MYKSYNPKKAKTEDDDAKAEEDSGSTSLLEAMPDGQLDEDDDSKFFYVMTYLDNGNQG